MAWLQDLPQLNWLDHAEGRAGVIAAAAKIAGKEEEHKVREPSFEAYAVKNIKHGPNIRHGVFLAENFNIRHVL